MSLIKCKKCGQLVSDKADCCSVCGFPVGEESVPAVADVRICQECASQIPEGVPVCPFCGAPVEEQKPSVCAECGTILSYNAHYCPCCGTPCNHVQEIIVPEMPKIPSQPSFETVHSSADSANNESLVAGQQEVFGKECGTIEPSAVEKCNEKVKKEEELPDYILQKIDKRNEKKSNMLFLLPALLLLVICGVLFFILSSSEAERTAQAKADSIAAENKRLKEELKAKEEADSIAAAEAAEQQRIEAERKAQEEAERIAAEAERSAFRTRSFTVNGVCFKMVAVGGGTFQMGATSEQQNPHDDEKPVHDVTLSDYYIGETEVTQALWEAVMGSNPSFFSGNSNPIEQASYNDCITFINKLNSLLSGQLPNGCKFRLPTEAEWEYAARGGNSSCGYQYSGSDNPGSVAWYGDDNGTHPVKQKQPNELGLYDMSGNVWEWCYDWYGDYPSSSQTNPKGSSSGSYRVLRGGSWNGSVGGCRVAYRHCSDFRDYDCGLRLALVVRAGHPLPQRLAEVVDSTVVEYY